MRFSELSLADAERYRACIEADGPVRLFELARLLEADGVDLGQFDASVESLVPLWEWYMRFAAADYPGVPVDAVPRVDAVEDGGADSARSVYASEFLMHYLFQVARTYLRDVAWVVEKRKGLWTTYCTQVRNRDDDNVQGMTDLSSYSIGRRGGGRARNPASFEPRYLADEFGSVGFVFGFSTRDRVAATARSGVSILSGLQDPGPALPIQVFLPATQNKNETHDSDEEIGDELMLAHRKANPENLERARKLDAAKVAVVLNNLGFAPYDGSTVTPESITADEFVEYVRADDAALIATESYSGQLRGIHIASAAPTRQAWEEIMTAFTHLAKKLHAKLARTEEFSIEDWEE